MIGDAPQHHYLIADAVGLATVALAWMLAGRQRRMMLAAGASLVPFVPTAGWFSDGSYWTPVHAPLGAFGPTRAFGGPVGIEDALFLFIAGARSWFFATLPARDAWAAAASPLRFAGRAAVLAGAAFAAAGALRLLLGLEIAGLSYAVPLLVAAGLLAARPAQWPLAAAGAAGSVVLAGLELRLWFALWPDYRAAWAPGAATSLDVLGVPLGDLAWWVVIGAVHPLAVAHCAAVTQVRR